MCFFYSFTNFLGSFLPHLLLRALIGWQAWDAGVIKNHAIEKSLNFQGMLPDFITPDVAFDSVKWWQLVGALLIIIGFRVRILSLGLILVTMATLWVSAPVDINYFMSMSNFLEFWRSVDVAIVNFKFELILLLLLVLLFFLGSGPLSIDALTGWFGCGKAAKKARKKRKEKKKLLARTKDDREYTENNTQSKNNIQDSKPSTDSRKKIKVKENISDLEEPLVEPVLDGK